jgi:hypothetical protein
MQLYHTNITIDNRCLDLLLTEDEITNAFGRSLKEENKNLIDTIKCCSCWPTKKPPQCGFWTKILGLCVSCDCNK